MQTPSRKAHLRAEYYRHATMWTGAEVLRELGTRPEGGLYARLAAILFAYLAFEGSLNHLGAALFPADWANERRLFAGPLYKGTLGKYSYLAGRCALVVNRGRRPYSTLKLLDKHRSALVHPKPERLTKTVTFTDPRQIPHRLESELTSWTTDRAIARTFEDVALASSTLVAAAKAVHPRLMHRIYGAGFTGMIGTQEGNIE